MTLIGELEKSIVSKRKLWVETICQKCEASGNMNEKSEKLMESYKDFMTKASTDQEIFSIEVKQETKKFKDEFDKLYHQVCGMCECDDDGDNY